MATTDKDNAHGTQSIERAIMVLRLLATHTHFGWGLTELAAACGLKKATTHRILSRLEHERLVHRGARGERYFIGPLVGELSMSIPGYHAFAAAAQAFAAELSRTYGLVAVVSLRSGDHFVVAGRSASARMKGELNRVGARKPLVSTAGGIAILIALSPAEQARIMESNRTLLLLRGHSKMDDCLAMWERSRQAGYGVNFEDLIPGVAAVAVGVAADGEAPFASLTLAGPPAQLPVERAPSLAALLRKEAVRFAALAATVHPGLYVRVSPCGPEDGGGRADAGDEH